jgi:peptide deformylase
MKDEVTPEEVAEAQEVAENPIITPADPTRWPLLEVPSQPVEFPLNDTCLEQIEKMAAVLTDLGEDACGIAAVQVGYPKQIFLTNQNGEIRGYINPQIVRSSRTTKWGIEGCLSIPGTPAKIPRPKSVVLSYFDIDGEEHEEEFLGFQARVIMHEMDHLQGTLIIEHMQQWASKQTHRTEFGMKLTPHRHATIKNRRRRNRNARKERRKQRVRNG